MSFFVRTKNDTQLFLLTIHVTFFRKKVTKNVGRRLTYVQVSAKLRFAKGDQTLCKEFNQTYLLTIPSY